MRFLASFAWLVITLSLIIALASNMNALREAREVRDNALTQAERCIEVAQEAQGHAVAFSVIARGLCEENLVYRLGKEEVERRKAAGDPSLGCGWTHPTGRYVIDGECSGDVTITCGGTP
jgi:hypothetical protein